MCCSDLASLDGGDVTEQIIRDFHAALLVLREGGYEVERFFVPESDMFFRTFAYNYTTGERTDVSPERRVQDTVFRSQLEGGLALLDLEADEDRRPPLGFRIP